ncbi:hypothetical protein [Streptomyces sp. AP-93]|uniref:hypothetical protein n=1 Tax=Streptomyces sp. AP-93 TaxID=2929048 RepID=UPI001FAF0B44|nr:hypothetical protein [Streptomyces sp. AP-93]MCJ0874219.1 hypothetical protein [Streptomyces sp. AP-93]
MTEPDPHRTSATLELLTLLTGGGTAPATAALPATAPATLSPTGRLRPPAEPEPEQQLRRRSDLRERLTDGIVELRKRRQTARPPQARTTGSEAPW